MHDQPPTMRDQLLTALACVAAGVVTGAAYTIVAPPLAPYAPFSMSGWIFALLAAACTLGLGVSIGYRRPRAAMASPAIVAALASLVYALMLALPVFSPNARNITGLVNYAVTQSTVTFFIIAFIGFPSAMIGMLGNYFWNDR